MFSISIDNWSYLLAYANAWGGVNLYFPFNFLRKKSVLSLYTLSISYAYFVPSPLSLSLQALFYYFFKIFYYSFNFYNIFKHTHRWWCINIQRIKFFFGNIISKFTSFTTINFFIAFGCILTYIALFITITYYNFTI